MDTQELQHAIDTLRDILRILENLFGFGLTGGILDRLEQAIDDLEEFYNEIEYEE